MFRSLRELIQPRNGVIYGAQGVSPGAHCEDDQPRRGDRRRHAAHLRISRSCHRNRR